MTTKEKHFIILFKPCSLDDNVELDLVTEKTAEKGMFKWLNENKDTGKHYSGYMMKPLTESEVNLYQENYSIFKKEFYKPSPFFGYD